MDRRVLRGHDPGADLEDPVDGFVHRALVARHGRRREDHRVAGVQLDVAVVVVRHPPKRGERLTLAAGGDHDHLFVREVLDLAGLDEEPRWRLRDAEARGDVEVLAHRAPDERDAAVELHRGVDHLLDAVDVGGEGGDDDPPLAGRERLQQRRTDARLRRRDAGPVGVGRIPAEQQQAVAAQLGEPRDVRGATVDRGLVELVVAGNQHRADLRREDDATGSRGSSARDGRARSRTAPPSPSPPPAAPSAATSPSLCSSSLERTIPIVSRPP